MMNGTNQQRGTSVIEQALLVALIALVIVPSVQGVSAASSAPFHRLSMSVHGGGDLDDGTGSTTPGTGGGTKTGANPPDCLITPDHPDCA